ncbi:hypothetical protein LAZ67_3005786, partial [Cordylochernes scorpioides]
MPLKDRSYNLPKYINKIKSYGNKHNKLGHTGSGCLIKTTNGIENINRRNPDFCSYIIGYLQKLSKTSKIHLQWIPSHVGIEGNEAADALAKKGTKEPLPQKNKLTFKEIETHSWYSGVNPGGALNIRNRQHQTTLTRFRRGHFMPLKIENNNKIYPTCPKCSLAPAAPEHILACIRCTKQDLWERPLLIIKQLEEHELMEFVRFLAPLCASWHFMLMSPAMSQKSLPDGVGIPTVTGPGLSTGLLMVLAIKTHLKNSKTLNLRNYDVIRMDHLIGRGGGTAIILRNFFKYRKIIVKTDYLENTTIVFKSDGKTSLQISSVYRKPDQLLNYEDLSKLFQNNLVIAAGDWNSKHPLWGSSKSNPSGMVLHEFSESAGLDIIAPSLATHYSHIGHPDFLDFAVFKNVPWNFEITTVDALSSDHLPVVLKLACPKYDFSMK